MKDRTEQIENSMLNPLNREIADMPKKNNYPKTRKKNRANPNTRKCPGAVFHDRARIQRESEGKSK